ncbi:2-amino-4-hydroxy-6-hydroxymethyldihydropteridine diphosphokinase [Candidatus Pelagibacter sp.]|nr:2-amino-4-hydroxy-6-hydroxymethyldihydropteridine diphosphokinase [Candidatus Pelagibacter sp.]
MLENPVKSIYLGVGSNLGNKRKYIEQAKLRLLQNNIKIKKTSSFYESLSWPNPDNPKFLNIVLEVVTDLSPIKLLNICKKIEVSLGRKKRSKNAPRECDIDLLDYNGKKIDKNIILPHPRMHIRNFVLLPLYELNKAWIHPDLKLPIKKLILSLGNKDIRSIKQI